MLPGLSGLRRPGLRRRGAGYGGSGTGAAFAANLEALRAVSSRILC